MIRVVRFLSVNFGADNLEGREMVDRYTKVVLTVIAVV